MANEAQQTMQDKHNEVMHTAVDVSVKAAALTAAIPSRTN
jgi:hypothetical protein